MKFIFLKDYQPSIKYTSLVGNYKPSLISKGMVFEGTYKTTNKIEINGDVLGLDMVKEVPQSTLTEQEKYMTDKYNLEPYRELAKNTENQLSNKNTINKQKTYMLIGLSLALTLGLYFFYKKNYR